MRDLSDQGRLGGRPSPRSPRQPRPSLLSFARPARPAEGPRLGRRPLIAAGALAATGLALLGAHRATLGEAPVPVDPPALAAAEGFPTFGPPAQAEGFPTYGPPLAAPASPTDRLTLPPRARIADVLARAGVDRAEAEEAVRVMAAVYDFRSARAGMPIELERASGRLRRLVLEPAPERRIVLEATDAGFRAREERRPLTTEVVKIEGTVDGSLWEAFEAAGAPGALALELAEVFRYDADFHHQLRPGDRFRVLVERLRDGDEVVRHGRLLAAELHGEAIGDKRLYWHEGGGVAGYFDARGTSASRALLRSPLKFSRVSSRFGYRVHPLRGSRHFHGGVDYAAPVGTPVHAVGAGRVVFAARKGGNGNLVILRHPGGIETYYLHLSKIHVRAGEKVDQSKVIGRVGMTGHSSGPHLDFRLKKNGRFVDPLKDVGPRTVALDRRQLPAFRARVAELERQLGPMAVAEVALATPNR